MSQQSDEDTVKFSVALRLARQVEAMSKHTPGPWEWSENLLISQAKPHDVVVRMHSAFRHLIADAALIAAAPDLLGACEAALLLLHFAAGPHEAGAVPKLLEDAINKAKGETP